MPEGAKAQTTRKTEETHISHLSRHLKPSRLAQTVTTADMQVYIDRRLRDKYRGKATGPITVKKEVATFRLIWNWAVAQGYLAGPAPTKGLKYPKVEEKPPFMTRGADREDHQTGRSDGETTICPLGLPDLGEQGGRRKYWIM